MKPPLCLSLLALLPLVSSCLCAQQPEPNAVHSALPDARAVSALSDQANPAREFMIPGPRRSFLRMAGISQNVTPEEILPLLSRNVFTEGYQGSTRPTEFLILLKRYVVQARELSELASNSDMVLHVTNCADARPLLHILGYRTPSNCGERGTSLQTEDPQRAFLAIDSGFPLPELERALQGGKPFDYPYSPTAAPVLFSESEWTTSSARNHKESSKDLIDTILNDSSVARLYWSLSRVDPETRTFLQQSMGIRKLLPYAAVLDFYGGELCVRDGQVRVPGGSKADSAWESLVGSSPANAESFVSNLLAKDKGWLLAYFDVLSRVSRTQQAYFTDPQRLRRFYARLRAQDRSTPATLGSFRPAPWLLLLAARLQIDPNGQPLVPGGLGVWKELLRGPGFKRAMGKQTINPSTPDQLLEALFGLTRESVDTSPLQIYMAISELESRRASDRRLSPATVRLLARKFEDFSDQYRIFSEFPELNDESMTLFLEAAQSLNNAPANIRGNALGLFQANMGIWQILARQGQIPTSNLSESWRQVIKPFFAIHSASQVYDAGRSSLQELFRSSVGRTRVSQDEIIDLLAGPQQLTPDGKQMHREFAQKVRAVLDDQRLVSLDTILAVGDALAEKRSGKQPPEYAVLLAGQTQEFQMPQPIFTNGERSEWAAGIYNSHHTDLQMRANLPKVLSSTSVSRTQIDDARGQLASFLRDTLVGLNYAYYEPPGAQALHENPLLVRSHDFACETVGGLNIPWQAPELFGQGSPAGGGAHFVGSIADLPYALAELEQDFISPANVQALIWKELTPELLISATVPRWWNVTPMELHAVALYQRAGEELLTSSMTDAVLRTNVLALLSDRLLPRRMTEIERALSKGQVAELLAQMMPSELFYLTEEFRLKYPENPSVVGSAMHELIELERQHPEQVSWKRLSHDFGTPHPRIAQNYGLELLNVAPMPPFAGRPSRFLAESWDSPNLYWARLADEAGYSPVMLNHIVPELTRMMVERIFATDFEDWSALLRAMYETGSDFRQGKLNPQLKLSAAQR